MSSRLELESMVDLLRKVGRERICSLADRVDREQEFSPELWTLLTELGVPGLPFSEAEGGTGGTFLDFVTCIREIAVAGACAALYSGPTVQVARAVMRFGTREQKQTVGLDLVQRGKLAAWSFTEPQTGSDPRQIRTVAVRDGDGWVLKGSKMFTSFAPYADYALVYAKTSEDRLSAFIVDTEDPGWIPGKPIKVMAFGGQGTCPVSIDGVRVPSDRVLGEIGQGFDIMVSNEAEGKIRASAICVGIGVRALEESVRYASERTHRDQPIGMKFPTVQTILGEMSAQVDGAWAMVRTAAEAVDRDDPAVKRLAASARIVCSRMAREVTSNALQVCGAYGLTFDMVLERLYREGKFYEVGQGVIDLQKIIVGKDRLREFASTGATRF